MDFKLLERREAQHSDFWAKKYIDELFSDMRQLDKPGADLNSLGILVQLNKIRGAIANFVSILTGESIPVHFKSSDRGMSFIGKDKAGDSFIVISSDLSDGNFDVASGIAMHEASHAVLTDMNYFATEFSNTPAHVQRDFHQMVVDSEILKHLQSNNPITPAIDMIGWLWTKLGHQVLNWIEDRRIDQWQQEQSPGYVGYYKAFYRKLFWHDQEIEVLESDFATDSSLEAYMYRFMTIIHPKANLNALPGLNTIYEDLDLEKINRLRSTGDAWDLSKKVIKTMIIYMTHVKTDPNKNPKDDNDKGKKGTGKKGKGTPQPKSGDGDDTQASQAPSFVPMAGDASDPPEDGGDTLEDTVFDAMKKSMDMKDLVLSGEIDELKKAANDIVASILEKLENKSIDIKNNDYSKSQHGSQPSNLERTIVVQRATDSVMADPLYSTFFSSYPANNHPIKEGRTQAKVLAKKIQIITEDRVTPYNRQKRGKIDPRRIYALMHGEEHIFYRKEIDAYQNATVWISVDASSSMSSSWESVVRLVVTLALAATQIDGFEVIVDFRGNTGGSGASYPCTVIAFDSRRDHIKQFLKVMSRIKCGSGTPEGLCIRGIVDQIPLPTSTMDSYFINICDGQPMWGGFGGQTARDYTRKLVNKKIKGRGIHVLGYFVTHGGTGNSTAWETFKYMYGNTDSVSIPTNDVTGIARTVNKLLLKKKSS